MFISETDFVEAIFWGGVQIRRFNPNWNYTKTYRPVFTNPEAIQNAVDIAMHHVGDKYSVTQAVCAGVLRSLNLVEHANRIDRNWFCSEFIAYVLRFGLGVNVCGGIALQSILPDDLEQWIVENQWQTIN